MSAPTTTAAGVSGAAIDSAREDASSCATAMGAASCVRATGIKMLGWVT